MALHLGNTSRRLIFRPSAANGRCAYQEIGMAEVDGKWNCTVESPMGAQEFVLTVVSAGDSFSGSAEGEIGRKDIADGSVDDDTLSWSMHVAKPMPVTLTCKATVTGDTLEGKVKAGIFGSFPITGNRAA
jgi:hypothetical protein